MKKFFIFAILIIALGGLISCNQSSSPKPSEPNTTVYHFESIRLQKDKMVGNLANLLPEAPNAGNPLTVNPSSLTEDLYNQLWTAKDGNTISRSYTKAQFKNFFLAGANENTKTTMEYALSDLITKGKFYVVICGLFTPNPGTPNIGVIKYYAVFNKR